jgi:nucleoside-diphosphate-sugar epimerase
MWILGCGYIGQRLARTYRDQGYPVTAVTRSEASRLGLAVTGLRALARDLTRDPLDDLGWAGEELFHLAPAATGRSRGWLNPAPGGVLPPGWSSPAASSI